MNFFYSSNKEILAKASSDIINKIFGESIEKSPRGNDLLIFSNYPSKLVGIRKMGPTESGEFIWVPSFEINFLDKFSLYNKLKIYLTFA